jgi:hypothetical protein
MWLYYKMEDNIVLIRYQRKPIFSCVMLMTVKNDLQHSVYTPVHISNESYKKVCHRRSKHQGIQYCTVLYSALKQKHARNYVTAAYQAYVDTVLFIQNDSYNNFKKSGRHYAEHYI